MTRLALITTTINVPTVLHKWARAMTTDDVIIVTGDLKSPHDEIVKCLEEVQNATGVPTYYYHPDAQKSWYSSDVIGWNCIQRRNIALLEALRFKPKYVATIDDDNSPITEIYFDQVIKHMENTAIKDVWTSSSGWYNAGQLCSPKVTHRGYPLSQRHKAPGADVKSYSAPVGVFASLWMGAPDIDAVERIVNDPDVYRVRSSVTLARGTWCPFNSQATVYKAELAPIMLMWPHVGRYDDIWASYLARTIMDYVGQHVMYGHPVVHQLRNPHDLVKDLEQEMFGMKHNEQIIELLRDVSFSGCKPDIVDYLRVVFDDLAWKTDFLPAATIECFRTWVADLESIK